AAAAAAQVRTGGALRAGALPSPRALELAAGYLERVRELPLLRTAVQPRARVEGSNEWGVAGRHTASGRPILANDPHLALDTPATFHQIHLRAPSAGIDVVGSGFAGVPYVVLGQNRYVAWGATTNPMDVTDTYQEQIVPDAASPSGLATLYLGQREAVIPVPELFRYNQLDGTPDNLATAPPNGQVAGTFIPPATLIVPRRNMGPIVALDAAEGTAISVQFTGFSATRELETFRLFNRARGLADFIQALQFFDFGSQNWAYADVDGNLAYFASGEMPLREDLEAGTVTGLPPFFLRNGTGGNEWLPAAADRPAEQAVPYQVLPFAEMPQLINPPSGWFVNANNDPAGTTLNNNPLDQLRPTGGIYYLNHAYAQGTRAGRITDLLKAEVAAGNVTPADMERIQADVVMLDAQVLVPHIVAALAHLGPGAVSAEVAEAVGRLAAWDGWAPTGIEQGWDASDVDGQRRAPSAEEVAASIAATIYSTWRGQMIQNTIDATIAPLNLPEPDSRSAIIALRHLLESFPSELGVGASGLYFFAGGSGATPAEQRDSLILDSLADALALLASPAFAPAFGGSTDQDDYRWGLLHRVVLDHPLGPPFSIPPAGGAFDPALPPGLPGIPVDGGFGVVDASSHSARADGLNEFMFGSGPVRRYVGELGAAPGGTMAVTALPGGESGTLGSPFYFNLLPLWLTNDGYAVIQTNAEVVDTALVRTIYVPAP
ncbi:MAG TPA: penicillin acylase family protein, partial [Thermoanaerobaculia bacterium]|nr:penicillin acylase family protein [Thermoanaerobaculia bacterium]